MTSCTTSVKYFAYNIGHQQFSQFFVVTSIKQKYGLLENKLIWTDPIHEMYSY